ncbi:MAG: sugar ABC transporter ATP-binding protein [Burkholderiales bacterium]|nr:sugar ABC transporter ATP-binding protein [Burkholderiales bacterium]MDE2395436.1 sugar ABC transporter ATP-binding protein [Burkholderiales bacterium]MDE2454542.1 sugar ABC transporter ATP-binding protein [Burkholderiales bacterium]
MLEFRKVEKTFTGVRALKGIDFRVERGEIVGLVGENGAGKSTLMKVLYGAYQHDGGEVLINDRPTRFANPREAMKQGIGMVFQEQSLIPNLSVMENIFLGFEQPFVRLGVIRWKRMAEAARRQLAKVHLDVDPYEITGKLSFAQRQMVELAKVLTLEERIEGHLVILLDEPTSVLAKEEVALLFKLVRELRQRASFIFVSHRLDEVLEISDRVYVLKDGEVVDVVKGPEARIESIQHKMVGREISKQYYREEKQLPPQDEVLLEARGLTRHGHYEDISLKLRRGEVLALVGVEGSGGESVMRTLFGLEQPESGSLQVKGRPLAHFSAADAVARGIGYIPRERKIEGIVAGMSVAENITLSQLGRFSRGGVLRIGAEKVLAQQWIDRLEIKAPGVDANAGKLSGGNQQKLVISKWRSGGSDIILLDHPTRGVDVGAKENIYEVIREMCADGCGVLLMADTLEEAIGLAHTIAVLKDGRIQQWFDCRPGAKPSLYDLVHHMT